MVSCLLKRGLERRQRIVEVIRLVAKAREPLMLVELRRIIVKRMDDHHGDPERFPNRKNRVEGRDDQRVSQALTLKRGIERETADEHRRYGVIASEMLVPVPASCLFPSQCEAVYREVANDAGGVFGCLRAYEDVGDSGVLRFIALHGGVDVRVE